MAEILFLEMKIMTSKEGVIKTNLKEKCERNIADDRVSCKKKIWHLLLRRLNMNRGTGYLANACQVKKITPHYVKMSDAIKPPQIFGSLLMF